MPVLDQIGESHGDSGVVVFAVNVGDDESDYTAYVEKSGHEYVRFARDGKRATATLYSVRSIPVTYVIDREGVIRYAHVGFGRALPKRLTDEIALLLEQR